MRRISVSDGMRLYISVGCKDEDGQFIRKWPCGWVKFTDGLLLSQFGTGRHQMRSAGLPGQSVSALTAANTRVNLKSSLASRRTSMSYPVR